MKLKDDDFQPIFEALFGVANDGQPPFINARTTSTRATAANRLSDVAGGLRQTVEAGVRVLKSKTVKWVLDHIISSMFMSNEDLCEPLALDYAKTMRLILDFQPHVEQLQVFEWEEIASFCSKFLEKALEEAAEENGAIHEHTASSGGVRNGVSHRSSRSTFRESAGSQGQRSIIRPVAEEMVACLRLLTAAPNAPKGETATTRIWIIIDCLKTSAISPSAHSNAFGAINNILYWMRTEGTRATQKATSQLLRLVRHSWSSKSAATGQMLITVLLLRPYISHAMRDAGAVAMHPELCGLLHTLEHEYASRLERERNELKLEDLRLEVNRGSLGKGQLATVLFTLRCTGRTGEMNWLLVNILAFLKSVLISAEQQKSESDDEPDATTKDINRRPRKRLRLSNQLSALLDATTRGTARERICALQTVTFLAQLQPLSNQQLLGIADSLTLSCSDDNVNICSWAFLAVASCAAQRAASDAKLTELWTTLWQLGVRSLGNSSTCRAAAYALSIMLAARLTVQTQSSELVHMVTHTMDLGGPSQLSESVALLLSITMRMSQQLNPAMATATAESIVGWLAKNFKPSDIEDKHNTFSSTMYEASDIISLTAACLGRSIHTLNAHGLPVWEAPARAWLFCEDEAAAVSYLLLNPPVQSILSDVLASYPLDALASGQQSRTSTEALVLSSFTSELTRCKVAWQDRTRAPSSDAFAMLCKAYMVTTCIAMCISFKDITRQTQLQELSLEMLKTMSTFVASTRCDADNLETFIGISSAVCFGITAHTGAELDVRSPCQLAMCQTVNEGLTKRLECDQDDFDDDAMDFDGTSESQHSRGSALSANVVDILTDQDASYSKTALRQNVHLYAVAVLALEAYQGHDGGTELPSTRVMDFVLSLSDNDLLSCRDMITKLPMVGLVFSADDTDRLLGYFMEEMLRKYPYKMSEVALGFVLDVMVGLVDIWTDDTLDALYNLGLDTYEWFAKRALSDDFFSPNVQQRLAGLLLQLCQLKPDYGRTTDAGTPRTCCFKLLRKLPISVQHQLADRIPIMFGKLVLSEHDKMFLDLEANLPSDPEWPEGMAIRLLHLSKLAASWRSLLRRCTWLMFDAAGRAKDCEAYARQCIEELATSLRLQSPRQLFSLFASQLLFTWMEYKNSMAKLPWEAFHFTSLYELLRLHRAEITAQLVLKQDDVGLELVQKAVKKMPRDVIKDAYAKCVAYCMSQDVITRGLQNDRNAFENRLRDAIGGSEEHKKLIKQHLPTIAGYMFLATEQDARLDDWLVKHPGYDGTLAALQVMMRYTRKEDELPPALQPSYKGTYLIDQLARLGRRAGKDPRDLWDASSFVLTARMLLDAIDLSLGSMQCCRMIRRVMILVAIAGEIALVGLSPKMLVHSVRPFLNDGICANDAIGLLQFIFDSGRESLRTDLRFTTGAIVLVILQMRKHSKERHESTTQESQHSGTVQVMAQFQTWLVQYLAELTTDLGGSVYTALTQALGQLQLPGNADAQSAESSLLLFLLDQWTANQPLCPREDTVEALQLLSEEFIVPSTPSDDCLGDDTSAVRYSQPIWEALQTVSFDDGFTTWAACVLGRAYAATGLRPNPNGLGKLLSTAAIADPDDALLGSQCAIINRVARLVFSRDRTQAGLAEYTLRMVQETFSRFSEPDGALQFQSMMPPEVYSAVCSGSYGYQPTSAVLLRAPGNVNEDRTFQQVFTVSNSEPLETWAKSLAVALSLWADKDAILCSLAPLFQSVRGLAVELLPPLLHVLLANGYDKVSCALADATDKHMSAEDATLVPKQQFFLKVLLYLRGQRYPGETTRVDRLKWLNIDYMNAAQAAARCGMPTAGLLLAECASPPPTQENRRTSKRASMATESVPAQIPSNLLLSVYKQIEEPDSFYGVPQEASLGSVLERLDHEGDGFRSMMFRSAQLDSQMRRTHRLAEHDAVGMVQSLSSLNFNSLAFALMAQGLGNTAECNEHMLRTARSLQQWDITPSEECSESSATFGLLQELSRSSEVSQVHEKSRAAILGFAKDSITNGRHNIPSHEWYANLAMLTEIMEVVTAVEDRDLSSRWNVFESRHQWMHMARYDDAKPFLSSRQTLFSVLSQNLPLQRSMHVTLKQCRTLEVEALLAFSRISREHSRLQEALTATTNMNDIVIVCSAVGLKIDCAVKLETASVLWDTGEASMSVKMLVELGQKENELSRQDIHIGRAGLLAQLGHESAAARLEKPEQILSQYLKPALHAAGKSRDKSEIGKVYYEFATFCDQELQNPSTIENLARVAKMRQAKEEEVEAYKQALRKKTDPEARHMMAKNLREATNWLEIDTAEDKRLRRSRSDYVNLSLQNYLQALQASDEHDICVLRFFALWLENTDSADKGSDAAVSKYLPMVPGWKFVRLMNQLMSRLDSSGTSFQVALADLLQRIFTEHPYHSLHHLYGTTHGKESRDPATVSRYQAAKVLINNLMNGPSATRMQEVFKADQLYKILADNKPERMPAHSNKIHVNNFRQAYKVYRDVPVLKVPPATITISLRPGGEYQDVPHVTKFDSTVSIMNGLSAPKMMKLWASDGKCYKELYKSGDDDLRQDAIMEQVFEEVSKMLRNHKATRQRDLKLRTYKVIPLSSGSGIIEFVPNSIPINEFLVSAHEKYYPKDLHNRKAREMTSKACNGGHGTTAERLATYKSICERLHPVMRHFFLERFNDPDEWFAKRTAYSRTTASISIMGHIIGLGDRHCSNILLDEQTGEIVHIDLGVAFEAGRVLPIPELVPFRLTRDIVDGMGATGIEGVFRRCCEFTLDAVREDKDSIMTLLNVLRYDPLHNWTISPLRAKRMQEAQSEMSRTGNGGAEQQSSRRKEQEAGEADRALSVVEKKLSKTLSTAAAVNELIQQATDETHLATLFQGWAAWF